MFLYSNVTLFCLNIIIRSLKIRNKNLFIDRDEYSDLHDIRQSFCFVAKALVLQGSEIFPNLYSTRVALAAIICTSILFFYHWEAMLISYVAVKKISLPIETLDDFSKNHKLSKGYKVLMFVIISFQKFETSITSFKEGKYCRGIKQTSNIFFL